MNNYSSYQDSLSAQNDITDINHQRVIKHWNHNDEWIIQNCGDAFFALGIFGQEIFIEPNEQMIFIRLGKKWDTSSSNISVSYTHLTLPTIHLV